jgi:hypothetical protein
MINKYISQLNEAQQAPVFQKDGPMIIIAGAGSGKTRVYFGIDVYQQSSARNEKTYR